MRQIMIFDDDEELRELLAELLTKEGFQVTALGNNHDVFEQLQQEDSAVVLLDLGPPLGRRDEGRSILTRLQERSPLSRHQIIAMSASVPITVGHQLCAAGLITAFVPKPFGLDEMLAMVQLAAIGGGEGRWSTGDAGGTTTA